MDNFFFSVIIPTYNPGKYIYDILESISKNKCTDDIEVILSDDLSTESFDDAIKNLPMLHVRVIKNKIHRGTPRDGRQNGAEAATGKWMCFADQDDVFTDNAFDFVKEEIIKSNLTNYIFSNFIEEDMETKEIKEISGNSGWTHGKLYEKKFWDKYKLCYDDVQYSEDINLTTKVGCIIAETNENVYSCTRPLYVWRKRSTSLGSGKYWEDGMPDYVKGTLGVVINYVEKYKDNPEILQKYVFIFLAAFLHYYFYFQNDRLMNKKQTLVETIKTIQPIYTRFKKATNHTNESILQLFFGDLMWYYQETRTGDFNQLPFIETMTISDWILTFFD